MRYRAIRFFLTSPLSRRKGKLREIIFLLIQKVDGGAKSRYSPFVFCPTVLCAHIQTQKLFESVALQHFQKVSGGSFDRKLL